MARAKTPKRHLTPDTKYNSIEITRLINYIMQDGKKGLASRIVYRSLGLVKERSESDPLEIFEKAKEQVTPKVEVKARRVGGANLQIPVEVRQARQFQLFLRWLIQAAKSRREKTMDQRLANEILDAAKGEGNAVKRRLNMNKSAQSHKAYSHLR
jgi:small subunit ribosomal protein S7